MNNMQQIGFGLAVLLFGGLLASAIYAVFFFLPEWLTSALFLILVAWAIGALFNWLNRK